MSALDKARAEAQSARHSASMTRMRVKTDAALKRLQTRLRESKAKEKAQVLGVFAITDVGALAAGQVAKMSIFPDDEGNSRGPLINWLSGPAAAATVVFGKAGMGTIGAASLLNGMFAGQLGIYSYNELDLWPFDDE